MTGGGTGGHIYPAITIADKIKEKHPDAKILFIGSTHGLEKKIVPSQGYPIRFVTVEGLSRKNMFKNIRVAVKFLKGSFQAAKIMEAFKPDLVIGTGGYVSAPIIKAGAKYGAKVYIHEQNAFPGLTNRISEKYADRVFLSFRDAGKYFKRPEKHVLSGNPVRRAFFKADKTFSRHMLGFKEDDFVVLAFGGSQGAGSINKVMMDVAVEFNDKKGMHICMATGTAYYDSVIDELSARGVDISGNSRVHIMEYITDMDRYLSAADVVICRSGALTVAEVTVCGTPAIFIPSPIVAGNHQYYNAKAVADKSGAVILPEAELTGQRLIDEIKSFEENRAQLADMAEECRKCASTEAIDIIYNNLDIPE